MEQSLNTDAKEAEIARLLGELADLSDEADALAACRREAVEGDPALAAANVAVDLLTAETDVAERAAVRALLVDLQDRLAAAGAPTAARRLGAALAERP